MFQSSGTYELPVALPLEEGGLLGGGRIAWSAYGERTADNVVVLLHDLSCSHRVLDLEEEAAFRPAGWGRELVGEGRPLDTTELQVLAPNLLGSPFGSTVPVVRTTRQGGMPAVEPALITVLDMARAVSALIRGHKIMKVRALVGVGLGGMVALQLAALFPELAGAVVILGAARTLPEPLRDRLGRVRQLLRMDPDYREGTYPPGQGPRRTLQRLRLELLELLHGREALLATHGDEAAMHKALEAEAEAFAQVFDANALALLCTAYAGADLSEWLQHVKVPVLLVAAGSDPLAPPLRVRNTYHLLSASGVRAHYHELPEPCDHTGLLTQARRLTGPLRDFLRRRG